MLQSYLILFIVRNGDRAAQAVTLEGMTHDKHTLAKVSRARPPVRGVELPERAREYLKASKASATRRAHDGDWAHFSTWCASLDPPVGALPAAPQTVAGYLSSFAGILAVSTLERRLASISVAHRAGGHATPTKDALVMSILSGIRRKHGVARNKKAPVLLDQLKLMVSALDDDLSGFRDRALLTVGFVTACRRAELAALNLGDLEEIPEGFRVYIRRSKTDQEAEGRVLVAGFGEHEATCPVIALRNWLARAGIQSGAVFRGINRHGHLGKRLSGHAVADIIKRRIAAVGLDPRHFGGHSLRSGYATTAAMHGVPEGEIAEVTGHKSMAVLRGYIHRTDEFKAGMTRKVGL